MSKVKSIKIKQSQILLIAILVSALAIFPRAISLYDVTNMINESYTPVVFEDIAIRGVFMLLFSWIILQFNVIWKYSYYYFSFTLRTVITILINFGIGFGLLHLLFNIYPFFVDNAEIVSGERTRFYFAYFVVFIILFSITRAIRYQTLNRTKVIENERLKQENLKNELLALKNQINPHFLFNSLNSLNSLIRENTQATTFVNKLSFMYRYILQSGDRNLVSISEELKFLDSYIYLIKTRYRNRFEVDVNIDAKFNEQMIPPLALQLLVENAVKHNEISEEHPLKVKVYSEDNTLIVENKVRQRTNFVESTHKGLSNLNKRFSLLKDHEILVNNANGIFKVILTLEN